MYKEYGIRILIAIGCMIVADIVHYFIKVDMVFFLAGTVYMAIVTRRVMPTTDTEDEP